MSGILEKLVADVEFIKGQLASLLEQNHLNIPQSGVQTSSPVVEVKEGASEKSNATTAETKVESQENPAEFAETDINGVPYNPVLHSGSSSDPADKRQNQAGQWKMRRGADKTAYQQWRKDHMVEGTQNQVITTQQGQGTATPPPSNNPSTPPPSSPTLSTPPSTTQETVNPRANVMKEVKELSTTYGVQHVQIEDVMKAHGADTLDAIPLENLQPLEVVLKGWGDYLEMIQSLIDDAELIDGRIAKVNQGGVQDGCKILLKQFNGDGVNVGTVPKEALSNCHDAVSSHVKQWGDWATAEGL